VSWDANGNENDETITHYIVDRPKIEKTVITRDYVQPQWIYDSINNRILIPASDYAPGCELPPHLSPFVDDYSSGYVPEYRTKLDKYYQEKTGLQRNHTVIEMPVGEDDDLEEEEEAQYAKELKQEAAGNYDEQEPDEDDAEDRKKKSIPKYFCTRKKR